MLQKKGYWENLIFQYFINGPHSDDNGEWYFGVSEDEWYVWVPDIDPWVFSLYIDIHLKTMRRLTKR